MELPHVGRHCGLATCHQLDFLPYTCATCKRVFCHAHFPAAGHACPELHTLDVLVPACPLCGCPVPFHPGDDPNVRMDAHIGSGCQPPESGKHKTYTNRWGSDVLGVGQI